MIMLQYINTALNLLSKITKSKTLNAKNAIIGVLLFAAMLLVGKYFDQDAIDAAIDNAEEIHDLMEQDDAQNQ